MSTTQSQSQPQEPVAGILPLNRNRDFMLLWTGAGFTSLGAMLTMTVYPLLVLWQTESTLATGLIAAATSLPHLLVQVPAGAIVDRFDRRRLMIFSDLGCVVVAVSVFVAVLADAIWLPHLIIAAFVQGSLSIFYELAERSAVRNLVHESQVPVALSRNEARMQGVNMLANPLGSLLFSLVRWTPFLLTAVMHLISLVQLLFIRKPFQAEGAPEARGKLYAEISEGIRWVWRQPFLRAAMLLISASNMIFMGMTLTLFAVIHDGGYSPAVVGLVVTAGGIGGVAGAMTATVWRRQVTMRTLVVGGLFVWAICIAPLAWVTDPWLLAVLFACNGYVSGVFNVAGSVYTMQVTPDHLFGRVLSVMMTLGSGANFLGSLLAGAALTWWGVTNSVLGMTALMGLLVVAAALNPSVRDVAGTPHGGRLPSGGE
ncbi:MFS transporter [Nonomuraea sp. SBT364]|uniref:MFS transporter n=1 Tax=Nonomuraea sp. SBT364 TaxID=1580530 RepID=UPI00066E3332|nr:MFS transporter [Nonomuraea sp. SBT364]